MTSSQHTPDYLSDKKNNVRSQNVSRLKDDLTRVARIMYTQSLALNEKIHTLSILQSIDSIILNSNRDLNQLGNDITKTVTDISNFAMVGILSLKTNSSENLTFQGWSLKEDYKKLALSSGILPQLVGLKIPVNGHWTGSKKRYLIIDFNDPNPSKELGSPSEETLKVFKILKEEFKLGCLYITKMIIRGKLKGLLIVGMEEAAPHLDDIELVERISDVTGIAIFNRLLYDENQNSLHQLTKSNKKLKEIDESKDEFISMASHQLRTPLTSTKGYLSMILDGDYGQISEEQKRIIQQAFNSSQKMAYLIADLLNVSRLRTGRFVIVNEPTALGQVVEEELSQLYETAQEKNITISYEKSDHIPKIMIDKTKIRQVIMNYLDNALFYTPAHGEIKVDLKLKDNYVYFKVTDTGMGVPEKEQKHLFSKYYRASNAQKIRPDGTGLGLYMAGKVIGAQGGDVIFYSNEGKGSTFGFRFPVKEVKSD